MNPALFNEGGERSGACARARNPFRGRPLVYCAFLALGVAVAMFSLTRESDETGVYTFDSLPRNGRPAFISTVRPQTHLSDSAPLGQQLRFAYVKLRERFSPPKPNPAGYRFLPSKDRLCSVHGLLNQCMQVNGARYLMAREVGADAIDFGHSTKLNGTEWVAAFEQALERNGYVLIREKPTLVKVIPQNELESYRKAGLVKSASE